MPTQRTFSDISFIGKFATRQRLEDPVSSDPSLSGSPDEGRVWYNTTTHKWMYYNGTGGIDPLARANHSGTQLASTISDFASTAQGYRLDQFAAPNIDLSINTHKLTNVVDPTNPQDASTKNYVDNSISGVAGGLVLKGAVVCASTTNVSLTTPGATIDGVTMSNPMTVLLTGQSTGSQNGPYVWTGPSATMTRATNWSTSAQAVLGSFWIVEQGSSADLLAMCTNDTAITIGTTTPAFVFRGGGTIYTGSSSILVSGGVISAITGTGLLGGSGAVLTPDFSIVGRKVQGIVPTTTTGIVAVSGAVLTINHGLNNSAPSVTIAAYSSPVAGYTAGDIVLSGATVTDANNISVTLPANPASNNWYYSIIG